MNRTIRGLVALGVAGVLSWACGGERGGQAEQAAGEAAQPAAQAGPVIENPATITGIVKFTGTPPAPRKLDMSEEPACAEKYPEGVFAEDVVANPNGTLRWVFVYVKEGLPAEMEFPAPSQPVVLDQDGCRYHPHVFGIQVGQPLEIVNSDPVLHNINAQPQQQRGFNISQPVQGMRTTRTFSAPEVMVKIGCDVHGWMQAWAGVLPHPYFDTTGEDGSFTLENLPPGTYTIEAWHERFGTQTQTVTVGPGESKTIEFTFNVAA